MLLLVRFQHILGFSSLIAMYAPTRMGERSPLMNDGALERYEDDWLKDRVTY